MQIEFTLTGCHDSWFVIQCFVLGRHASKIQCLQANQKMMHQMKAISICGLLLLWPCWCRNMASISYPTKHNTIRMGVSDNFYRICNFVSQSSVFGSPRAREPDKSAKRSQEVLDVGCFWLENPQNTLEISVKIEWWGDFEKFVDSLKMIHPTWCIGSFYGNLPEQRDGSDGSDVSSWHNTVDRLNLETT